jgi:hypothetical protein
MELKDKLARQESEKEEAEKEEDEKELEQAKKEYDNTRKYGCPKSVVSAGGIIC